MSGLAALLDEWHPRQAAALAFSPHAQAQGWATCPITEDGFLRIVGHADYRQGPGTPEAARSILAALCASPGHQLWPDAATLHDTRRIAKLPAPGHLADAYLLALAVGRGGKLTTFDRRIDPARVAGGFEALNVLPAGGQGT